MRKLPIITLMALLCGSVSAQQKKNPASSRQQNKSDNIYSIRKLFLEKALHNPEEHEKGGEDNDLSRFNRWFNMAEARTYPSGDLPDPNTLLKISGEVRQAAKSAHKTTSGGAVWQSLGPSQVPSNYDGIGRVNCIVIDPADTNTLFVGTACGGVWISHDGGVTWMSNTDNFPSLSIADIAVNPRHRDTIYAATGDGYGYENSTYNIFWGGLYTAGVMMSTDTGHTWTTTGLSYLQTNTDMIQKLLIHPNKTGTLLAATRNGLLRSTDAGATWTNVSPGHIFSMVLHPTHPDTVYAIGIHHLMVSYDAGATWAILYSNINATSDRCSIAVSPAAPDNIWVLNDADDLIISRDGGVTFSPSASSPSTSANFYGYYDRVLAVSPTDSNYVLCFGKDMTKSTDGGSSWSALDLTHSVHVDNHAATINPYNTQTIYTGNDGGIAVTHDRGQSWTNLANGLTISQIYRISSSRQDPTIMLCGVQDNGSFYHDGTDWWQSNAPSGDGMDNAIHPLSDQEKITSYQYGNFYISHNQGAFYSPVGLPSGIAGTGAWISPVVFNPRNADTIFFGMKKVYASYDGGASAVGLGTGSVYFSTGAITLAVAPSNPNIIYAGDYSHIIRTIDGGTTWTTVSAGLPGGAKVGLAVDYNNPMKVYVTISGYVAGSKVFRTTTGGAPWTNISSGLPNLPANCVAVDSSQPGGLFVGTDMGVYYRDSADTVFTLYNTGLPNVIVDDLDINYTSYKVKAATYGRGVWECKLKKDPPNSIKEAADVALDIKLFPNPTTNSWKVVFGKAKPPAYSIRVRDVAGRLVRTQTNNDLIDATNLTKGVYTIEISSGIVHQTIKAVRN